MTTDLAPSWVEGLVIEDDLDFLMRLAAPLWEWQSLTTGDIIVAICVGSVVVKAGFRLGALVDAGVVTVADSVSVDAAPGIEVVEHLLDEFPLSVRVWCSDEAPLARTLAVTTARVARTVLGYVVTATDFSHEVGEPVSQAVVSLRKLGVGSSREEYRDAVDRVRAPLDLALTVVRGYQGTSQAYLLSAVGSFRWEVIGLSALVHESVNTVASMAAMRGINLDLDTDASEYRVRVPRDDLRRCLLNVMTNAIKYSYAGGTADPHDPSPTWPGSGRYVAVRVRRHDPVASKVAIVVENYGFGLSDDEVQAVFRRGFRGLRARLEVSTGIGIGLTEARRIARVCGGDVTLKHEHKHGSGETAVGLTTVRIVLPIHTR